MASKPTLADPYQAEDDHRTIMRAAEIQGDRKRMGGVRKHQIKQTKALKKVGSFLGKK
jgi:hypothetical protein